MSKFKSMLKFRSERTHSFTAPGRARDNESIKLRPRTKSAGTAVFKAGSQRNSIKDNVEKLGQLAETYAALSEGLARIVAEEHSILDNPLTSPPLSFPQQLHKLERLNTTAQTNIIKARVALREYVFTIRSMRDDMELHEMNMLQRAVQLRRSSEATFQKVSMRMSDNADYECSIEPCDNEDEVFN